MLKELLWQKTKAMSDLKDSSALNYAVHIIFLTALFMKQKKQFRVKQMNTGLFHVMMSTTSNECCHYFIYEQEIQLVLKPRVKPRNIDKASDLKHIAL